jgi:hypothetical protein
MACWSLTSELLLKGTCNGSGDAESAHLAAPRRQSSTADACGEFTTNFVKYSPRSAISLHRVRCYPIALYDIIEKNSRRGTSKSERVCTTWRWDRVASTQSLSRSDAGERIRHTHGNS